MSRVSDRDNQKRNAALSAIDYIDGLLSLDSIIGVGTGSTTNHFIDALGRIKHKFDAAVASSQASQQRLQALGIPVIDLNAAKSVLVYVDGADEADPHLRLIKGGGGAMTREKIIATVADSFVCIVDEGKCVDILGRFPLPVEVIPMSRSLVARQLVKLGGRPEWREGVVTDNGNWIIDVHDLTITDPSALESAINDITGVVSNGIFGHRPADVLMIGTDTAVRTQRRA